MFDIIRALDIIFILLGAVFLHHGLDAITVAFKVLCEAFVASSKVNFRL